MNVDKHTINILKRVAFKLDENNINWLLFGGVNLALKGVVYKFSDVDILIKNCDVEKLYNLFLDYDPSDIVDFESGEAQSFSFKIDGVEFHICADYDFGFYYKKAFKEKNIEQVNIGDFEIPTLNLSSEVVCYSYIGRPERANLIKSFIEK